MTLFRLFRKTAKLCFWQFSFFMAEKIRFGKSFSSPV
ncbi:hypothetical protein LI17339_03750 [Bacillus licheniformis LMG 17339]|nr:hypothetical protein LI17339_03750 [Bacillus licheniformis LMG 17339]